ncbi:DUF4244 domain-containing protein [Vallicoccus soli]|uniref:DUF4244 domain-containing protein n=1 Tax=Vallicoccus soli TaxID=2339232 RepID=A0A3A3Z3Z9_9ACTN|nr:DUF4244 domain-containing protein [Vallicoccus soli]RJK97683.1 DUF4244 domain-containing protein [Vallicoccus soli]
MTRPAPAAAREAAVRAAPPAGRPAGRPAATTRPARRPRSPVRPALHLPARLAGDDGMTTAEYAVGTVAACGFAGLLYKVLTSGRTSTMLGDIVERALSIVL